MGLRSSRATSRTMRIKVGLLRMGAVREVQAGNVEAGRTSLRKISGVLQAGPSVATILARRVRSCETKGIMFGLGFKEVFMSRFAGTFSPS